jgi:hypothetical protein
VFRHKLVTRSIARKQDEQRGRKEDGGSKRDQIGNSIACRVRVDVEHVPDGVRCREREPGDERRADEGTPKAPRSCTEQHRRGEIEGADVAGEVLVIWRQQLDPPASEGKSS